MFSIVEILLKLLKPMKNTCYSVTYFFFLLWKILSQDWRKEVSTVFRCQPWQSMALAHLPTGSQQRLQRMILMVRPFPITVTLISVFFVTSASKNTSKNLMNFHVRDVSFSCIFRCKTKQIKKPWMDIESSAMPYKLFIYFYLFLCFLFYF